MTSFRVIVALGALSVFTASPCAAEMCPRFQLKGSVKRFVLTEQMFDPQIGRVVQESKETHRITVAKDGSFVKNVVIEVNSPKQRFESTAYYDSDGRMVRGTRTQGRKISVTLTCFYDSQGRLTEARDSSDGEFNLTEQYEYSAGIRRRRLPFVGPLVITETLDGLGRVVKEEQVHETLKQFSTTYNFSYDGDRQERCGPLSSVNPSRYCVTTVRDSHGNEIESGGEYQSRKTVLEYDAAGNWTSKTTVNTWNDPRPHDLRTTSRRKIEYR